jgi:signal transduction histidine kinase
MEELLNLKIVNLLSEEGLKTIKNLEQRLLKGEDLGSLIEVEMVKNDRTRVVVQLAGSLVFVNKDTIGLQYIARDVTEEKRMQQNQRFLLQQVTRAQEEERKRIAQEIHDETVQALVVLCQEIDNLVSHSKRSPRKTGINLEHLHERASSIMQGARRLSQDLRPAALDNLGLVPTLEWLASDITSYSGISIDVNVLGTIRRLSDEAELVLFRITQEALRNVSKHAQATSAEVKLEFTNNSTRVTVVDNGIGFIPPQEVSSLPRIGKLGLAGMQERAQLLGGTLTVKSEPTKGTTLTAELPV